MCMAGMIVIIVPVIMVPMIVVSVIVVPVTGAAAGLGGQFSEVDG